MTWYQIDTISANIEPNSHNGEKRSDTTKKLRGGITGKGFMPGFDPKRNLNGRPKSFDEVRALAQTVAHEGANTIKILRILRDWAGSDDVSKQRAFVEYAFGKVPDKIETTGLETKTTLVLHYANERPDLIEQDKQSRN